MRKFLIAIEALLICALLVTAPALAQYLGSITGNDLRSPVTAANPLSVASSIAGAAVSATNGTYTNILQGNAVLSATNGIYGNVLQGNAALSSTNGLFANVLQGNAVISATNGLYANLLQGNAVVSASNPSPVQASIGNAAVSATNGLYANLLQGNAVVSATNPAPVQLSQGSAAITASNPLPVFLSDSSKATYCTTFTTFTPYATPTDVIAIVGSGTKTVRIHKIYLSSTQTAAGINQWFLIKRSAADTSGTPSAGTQVPLDSTNAAGTATIQKYASAPSVGAAVGTVRIVSLLSPAAASVAQGDNVLFDDSASGEPITLRGVAQELDVNFNGAAVPTGFTGAWSIETTEE